MNCKEKLDWESTRKTVLNYAQFKTNGAAEVYWLQNTRFERSESWLPIPEKINGDSKNLLLSSKINSLKEQTP